MSEVVKKQSLVYFIQFQEGGPIKIGNAVDPVQRMADLQVACPFTLSLVMTMEGGRTKEKQIHHHFEKFRIRGEWFKAEEPLLTFMKSGGEFHPIYSRPDIATLAYYTEEEAKKRRREDAIHRRILTNLPAFEFPRRPSKLWRTIIQNLRHATIKQRMKEEAQRMRKDLQKSLDSSTRRAYLPKDPMERIAKRAENMRHKIGTTVANPLEMSAANRR